EGIFLLVFKCKSEWDLMIWWWVVHNGVKSLTHTYTREREREREREKRVDFVDLWENTFTLV
ncbi:MAG: hypothetical protein N7Q72_04510, partial [Spiroplasma sp. Tabriz.8]|nr:hypothetical protein [Spiroplasma sp. Tabriz.8]